MKSPLVALAECGVPLLLVGGTAVQCYGSSRFTKDYDCIVASDQAELLAAALQAAGYEEFDRHEVVVRYRHKQQAVWVVDTLFCDSATFAEMWSHRRSERLGQSVLAIASPLHLVGMKLHAVKHNPAREMRDLWDCWEVIRRQRATFSRAELAVICDQFGTPELKAKLLRAYDE